MPASAFSHVGAGPLVRADLFAHGVSKDDLGTMMTGGGVGDCQHNKTDLFGGKRMTLARWPNIDAGTGAWRFANIDGVDGATLRISTTAQPATARLAAWAADNPWVHGYWTFDWTDSYVGVANISAADGGADAGAARRLGDDDQPDARFYGVNLLCELDAPGEYYVNEDNGTLYFYPPSPLAAWPADASVALTAGAVAST